MKLIYINKGTSPSLFAEYLKAYNNVIPQQAQKYNQLLMEGFVQNGVEVLSLSTRPLNRSMTKQKYFCGKTERENGIDYCYVPFFNIKFLRECSVFFGVFFRVLFSKTSRKDGVVICDALNIAGTIAALCASFFRGFKTVGIVTDVPCHFSNREKIPLHQKINLAVMRKFKSYLLLTEQMSEIVNPKNRPYIVMEGHADVGMAEKENTLAGKANKKVCLYAGSLRRIYGIGNLVEGFLAADIPDTELHIYGDGDFRPELEEIVKTCPNIKYFGTVPNSVIVEEELKATLLVNPRPTNEDYTKYSFPSKNMEYMASGTPVLTTKLPGMPTDHLPHVYLIEEETADGIRDALVRVLTKSPKELHAFGADAKRFILEEKNNVMQAKKVVSFLQNAVLVKKQEK